jgi:hypothetical protein
MFRPWSQNLEIKPRTPSPLSPTFLTDLSHVAFPKRTYVFSSCITEITRREKNESGRNEGNIKGKIVTRKERKKRRARRLQKIKRGVPTVIHKR